MDILRSSDSKVPDRRMAASVCGVLLLGAALSGCDVLNRPAQPELKQGTYTFTDKNGTEHYSVQLSQPVPVAIGCRDTSGGYDVVLPLDAKSFQPPKDDAFLRGATADSVPLDRLQNTSATMLASTILCHS